MLSLAMALTFFVASCGGDSPVNEENATEKKCCADKEKCEHKSDSKSTHEACPPDCEKPCC